MGERIGEILIRKKLITEIQLDEALKEQKESGDFLGDVLVRKGFVSEKNFLESLAGQFNTTFVELGKVMINPQIDKMIPKRLVWQHKVMPIEMRNSVLLIAFSNPLDMWPLSDLQEKLKLTEVKFVLAARNDVLKTIERYYGPETAV